VAYLFSCTALAGAFGGLLAYALLQMDGVAGYAGWRWVYIIEGCFSVLIAVAVWFGLPTNPAEAWFLSAEQKHMMRIRSQQRAEYMGSDKFDWQEIRIAFQDPKLYLSGAIQFCQDILLYGFSTFLPAILKGAGYNTLQSNYLTVPVYIFGAICFVAAAFASDRLTLRAPFILFANIFGIVGYIVLLTVSTDGVRYFATFLCAVAVYNGPGLNVTWINVNVAPHYRRATTIGFQQTIANTAGIVAGQIYRKSPYRLGHSFSLGALCLAQVLIVVKMLYIKRWNTRKEKIARGEIPDTRKYKTGDRALDYKYHL